MTGPLQRTVAAMALLLLAECAHFQVMTPRSAMILVWSCVAYDIVCMLAYVASNKIMYTIVYEVNITLLLHGLPQTSWDELAQLVVLISISDIAQYLGNDLLGRHQVGFGTSPHKSW